MPREIDDAFIEEAIASYRRIEERQTAYRRAVTQLEVTVRSPDELVEVVVDGDGAIRRVTVIGSIEGCTNAELSRSIQRAISAADDAAGWARRKLHDETFKDYPALGSAR